MHVMPLIVLIMIKIIGPKSTDKKTLGFYERIKTFKNDDTVKLSRYTPKDLQAIVVMYSATSPKLKSVSLHGPRFLRYLQN